MRIPIGQKCNVVLEDGTTVSGVPARSWRWRTIRLNAVTVHARGDETTAEQLSYFLIPARRVLFVQVGV